MDDADFVERRRIPRDQPQNVMLAIVTEALDQIRARGARYLRSSWDEMAGELVIEGWRYPITDDSP